MQTYKTGSSLARRGAEPTPSIFASPGFLLRLALQQSHFTLCFLPSAACSGGEQGQRTLALYTCAFTPAALVLYSA